MVRKAEPWIRNGTSANVIIWTIQTQSVGKHCLNIFINKFLKIFFTQKIFTIRKPSYEIEQAQNLYWQLVVSNAKINIRIDEQFN